MMSLVVLLCHRWNSIYQLVFSFVCLFSCLGNEAGHGRESVTTMESVLEGVWLKSPGSKRKSSLWEWIVVTQFAWSKEWQRGQMGGT